MHQARRCSAGEIVIADARFYNVREAARYLGVNRSTVWRWIEAGRLTAYRVGPKAIRIKREDLDRVVVPSRSGSGAPVEPVAAAPVGGPTVVPLPNQALVQRRLQALARGRALRDATRTRRGGARLSPSWELIREAREERSQQT